MNSKILCLQSSRSLKMWNFLNFKYSLQQKLKMSSVQAAKSILRKEMKSRLLAMSKEQILLESEQLTKKVIYQIFYRSVWLIIV